MCLVELLLTNKDSHGHQELISADIRKIICCHIDSTMLSYLHVGASRCYSFLNTVVTSGNSLFV
jgi:hypothetical protein